MWMKAFVSTMIMLLALNASGVEVLDSWGERWRVDEVQFIKALNEYKSAKNRLQKIKPAVVLHRAEETLLKSRPAIKDRLTPRQQEVLRQARRQFLWAKGVSNRYLRKMDFFNVHFITKTNEQSIHRLNEAFRPLPEKRTCSVAEFKKLADSLHPEFLIEFGRTLKTLVFDYEFVEGENYFKNFQQIINERKKFFTIPNKEEMFAYMQAVLVDPVKDNGERVQRRINKLETELKKIAKVPKGFVFDQYRANSACLRAYPEQQFYELLKQHQTNYYGEKTLALIQLYIDKHKKLPPEKSRWQTLFDFYKTRSNRLKDEKEPSEVFLAVIRDGWGRRFNVLVDKNQFWVYTDIKLSTGESETRRFGPGFIK